MLNEEKLHAARRKLIQMHFDAQVGHLGGNLSCLDVMMLIHHEFLDKGDKFILSKGHSAGALYITLNSLGLISEAEIKTFHSDGTRLAAHPVANLVEDILFSTGSLGHGLALACGVAMAWKLQGKHQNVFCLMSDGEWQEGSTWESLIFASHHNLANLTVVVDKNGLQGFGRVSEIASMHDLAEKLKPFNALIVTAHGHQLSSLRRAFKKKSDTLKIIVCETTKGYRLAEFEDKMESHYLPPSKQQLFDFLNDSDLLP